jgi:hypothetical protein
MEMLGATFAHIYYTSRISPSLLRSSTDAPQEVGPLLVSLCKEFIVILAYSSWTLPRQPIPARRCLDQRHALRENGCLYVCSTFLITLGEHKLSLQVHVVKLQHSMLRPSLPVLWTPAGAGFK